MKTPWDLEGTPLQIKTDSKLDSDERILVYMYDKDSSFISSMTVLFTATLKYTIGFCRAWTELPVQPPVEVDKIWTLTKTEIAIIITCNNVEVLNYLFADSGNSNCVPKWGGDVVEKIMFHTNDAASDFYRAGKSRFSEA